MQKIGFLKDIDVKVKQKYNKDDIFKFDSGNSISLEEAGHNCIILGTTGSGKTSSFVSPKLYNLIRKGYGGLVFDIKNNFTSDIRKIAKMCGRENDIIEIGTHDTAKPINFLLGLNLESMLQSLENVILGSVPSSNNKDFIQKGINNINQMAKVLFYIKKNNPKERHMVPSLHLLSKMSNNNILANQIYTYWLKNINETDKLQVQLKEEIESDKFNFLLSPASTNSKRSEEEWYLQTTYRLSIPRKILSEFCSGALQRNLSSKNNNTLCFKDLILDKNKIVIVRFSAMSGTPGARFSKMVKEEFYKTIFNRFYTQDTNNIQYIFNIMDEFQDILNLDEDSLLDDFTWISKSREFKVVNVVATQSISSLYKKEYQTRVMAMLNNFNVKIIMQNDDPNTLDWVRKSYNTDALLTDLGPSEALVIKKSLPERKFQINLETAQKSHDKIRYIINTVSESFEHNLKPAI